jgi:hypothetical protein
VGPSAARFFEMLQSIDPKAGLLGAGVSSLVSSRAGTCR